MNSLEGHALCGAVAGFEHTDYLHVVPPPKNPEEGGFQTLPTVPKTVERLRTYQVRLYLTMTL